MTPLNWLRIGAIFGALAVAFGAFGAHVLTPRPEVMNAMETPARQALERLLANYNTGAHYHLAHALAIVAVGLANLPGSRRALNAAGWLFVLGILGFSGSLYAMAMGAPKWLGMIVTPTGGMLLIAGWIALAVAATSGRRVDPVVETS